MVTAGSLRERVVESVRAGFQEQLEYTKALVRFESVRGAEHAIQDYVFRSYKDYGLGVDRFMMDRSRIEDHPGGSKYSRDHSDAPIIVGIHHPQRESGRSLILQAHVDVVPTGPATMWSRPPLDPRIAGAWMF